MDKLARKVVARFKVMKRLGEVSVDSGTLLVIDPAYLSEWGTGEHPDLSMEGYRAAWKAGRNQLCFANGKTAAVFIKGFGGDGTYPVLVEERNEEGPSIGSLALDFMPGQNPLVAKVVAGYKRAALKARTANVEYGYGTKGKRLSYQGDFDETAPCVKCGKPAELALVLREKFDDTKTPDEQNFVTRLHENPEVVEGERLFWLHDCAAFALYVCRDFDCTTVTTHWNQA